MSLSNWLRRIIRPELPPSRVDYERNRKILQSLERANARARRRLRTGNVTEDLVQTGDHDWSNRPCES